MLFLQLKQFLGILSLRFKDKFRQNLRIFENWATELRPNF